MKKEDLLNSEFLKQFKTGNELNDFITSLRKRGVEQLLEGEMDAHLGYDKNEKSSNSNTRNGHIKKRIKTEEGDFEIQVPRDREATFEPQIVPKRKSMVEGIEDVIVSLYAKGMSTSDIEEQIKDIYGYSVSTSTISRITDRVTEDIQKWQNRPLEPMYFVVWMDGISFKVREGSKVINKTIYIALGLTKDGHKEVLGLWLSQTESASYWMTVLTDLKMRGVSEIFITATDNLKGFTDAISTIYPQCETQICVVHQIRNACKYVVYKDRKAFTTQMREIYTAPNRDTAWNALLELDKTWGVKYQYAIKGWKTNWENLTPFFAFPAEIRRIIYTTNTIENLNGKIRKYTRNKMSFPTDDALMKSVFLAVGEATKKWGKTHIHNWGIIFGQFSLIFEKRLANL
jgi:putative transposase